MLKVDQLIRTKLHPPYTRPGLVSRPRLQEQIAKGICCPLTLVTAPAGFGKTSLVAKCVADCGMRVAWLSLDKEDNQARRFLAYLIAALQTADERIGREAAQFMAEEQEVSPEAVLTSLINDLATANSEIVLVLDDYQFINSPEVNSEIAFLLNYGPQTLHLLIATRSDPPLPFARLRAHHQLVELRAADLRFTAAEAGQFLNDIMGLHLDEGSIRVLEERTEGWIAGLQMAALSIRDHKDFRKFIEGFSGTNRYILDYLLEEVLASQPPEIQTFLLSTSILERLTAPLCEAVLNMNRVESWSFDQLPEILEFPNSINCQSILTDLERANLFLVTLDDERKWYRYHHLFADLLRARLDQLYPGLALRLHATAAVWYESNGFHEEAIQHVLAAKDYQSAARLVEAIAENAWLNGHFSSILGWTKAIPPEITNNRPWLCIWNAWAYTQLGVVPDIDQWIAAAEQAVKNLYGDNSVHAALTTSLEVQALAMEIAALRAFSVSFSRDYDRAIALAETVLKNPLLPDKKVAQFTRCNLLHLLSSMYYATGDLRKAEQTAQEAVEIAKAMGLTLRLLHCINKLVLIHTANGHLHRAYQTIEETLSFLQQQHESSHFAALQLEFRKLDLLYERNQLEEFQHQVETVIEQTKRVDALYLIVDSYNIQALDLLIKQDYSGVQEALDRAKAIARQTYIWEGLSWRTERLQVRLWLAKGELSLASRWAAQKSADLNDSSLRFPVETRAVAQARILLLQGASREAISLLDRLSTAAQAEGRNGSLIEFHTLKAVALLRFGELDQAVAEVKSTLDLAEPEGYMRTFLDEGEPILTLLSQVARNTSLPQARYAQHLVTALQGQKESIKFTSAPGIPYDEINASVPFASLIGRQAMTKPQMLVEPLSQRELEILHLLAEGKTNQEIALQLVVATGTIKAHAASIYRKLDVANRTEAVTRARQLKILP